MPGVDHWPPTSFLALSQEGPALNIFELLTVGTCAHFSLIPKTVARPFTDDSSQSLRPSIKQTPRNRGLLGDIH